MRCVKFVRLALVICDNFCDMPEGRTKPDNGPISVGRVSLLPTGPGFLLLSGGALDCVDEPGIGIRLPKPRIGIRDWLS